MRSAKERREQAAAHWLIENERGDLTPRQRALFARWITDPRNQRVYAALKHSWDQAQRLRQVH